MLVHGIGPSVGVKNVGATSALPRVETATPEPVGLESYAPQDSLAEFLKWGMERYSKPQEPGPPMLADLGPRKIDVTKFEACHLSSVEDSPSGQVGAVDWLCESMLFSDSSLSPDSSSSRSVAVQAGPYEVRRIPLAEVPADGFLTPIEFGGGSDFLFSGGWKKGESGTAGSLALGS